MCCRPAEFDDVTDSDAVPNGEIPSLPYVSLMLSKSLFVMNLCFMRSERNSSDRNRRQ